MTRQVKVKNILIGGGAQIPVQSMLNVPTSDASASLRQIRKLEKAGCDLVRLTVNDEAAAKALPDIIAKSPVPLIADIHFDYRLAIAAINAGIAKLRINPGNIGDSKRVKAVAEAAGRAGVPIRIGVNSGSLREDVKNKVMFGKLSLGEAMGRHALGEAKLLERFGFRDIVISVKATNVLETVRAYEFLHENCDYPLHIGITEAGTVEDALLKSGAGLGHLLLKGIGDTLRISITGPVEKEAEAGRKLLQFLGLRPYGPEVVSCPTCGRTQVALEKVAESVGRALRSNKELKDFDCKVAVMGCVVNGPGEASAADVGLAGGKGYFLLFSKGKALRRVSPEEAVEALVNELLALKKGKKAKINK